MNFEQVDALKVSNAIASACRVSPMELQEFLEKSMQRLQISRDELRQRLDEAELLNANLV